MAFARATQHLANTGDPAAPVDGVAEIIAVDAMQVYWAMDIGTAKPTWRDQAHVVHHCLDLVAPDHDFALAEYAISANRAIAEIDNRGGRPVLVAGTGLYLRAVTDPMELPGMWPEIREALEARAVSEPVEDLHRELAALDPDAAAKIKPANARRVVRALEVCLGSGRRFSSFGPGLGVYPPTRFVQIGLRWGRPELADRIERRVQHMLEAGLLAEVESVLTTWPELSRTARQALGYRELLSYLDGAVSFDEAVAQIVLRTRQFAVRQERWFRRDPRIQWVDIHADPVAEVLPVISERLSTASFSSVRGLHT